MKEFNQNRQSQIHVDEELQNPEDMEIGAKQAKKGEEQDVSDANLKDYDSLFKKINDCYNHEKKKVIFMMYTARKLRNLSKNKSEYKKCHELLMLCACLLLKKGILLSDQALESLEKGGNPFKLEHYDLFREKSPALKDLINTFKVDDDVFKSFLKQM